MSVEPPYYIQAASPAADEQRRVLKHGDTFALFDHYGDFVPTGQGEQGLFHDGTRYLSCLILSLDRQRPLFLSSTIREGNDALAVDLTNPDVTDGERVVIARGTLHIARDKFLWKGTCYERMHIHHYAVAGSSEANQRLLATLMVRFTADFADIFEVRGTRRAERGQLFPPMLGSDCATLSYQGLDNVCRRTKLHFDPPPAALVLAGGRPSALSGLDSAASPGAHDAPPPLCEARFDLDLPPHGKATIDLAIVCGWSNDAPELPTLDEARHDALNERQLAQLRQSSLQSNNQRFNDWVDRSTSDLHMMVSATPYGYYPYAGVPWFSTPFGRDGIITALECLWLDPEVARGVLAYLAATQATETNPIQDAQPGKILHETRGGEMAALGEIPFGRYYGSVDATPLFVLLAGAYYERTGDRTFIESIWKNIEAAMRWCDTDGDADGDGFVEYARNSPQGLVHQGWKDSHDSIFHADGTSAEGSIALCEVQGYVFAAKRAMASLMRVLGNRAGAIELDLQADRLRERFEEMYWCEELGTYALALDGAKRPCRVRTSNAGHCLATGIVRDDRAVLVARALMHPDAFSGWGVRTVSASEARYNPMSYHNGSVWPHDNALIAWGLSRYGLQAAALTIFEGLFAASEALELHRLPELFCGFARRPGEGPTHYPVACSPQAWSAGAVYMLVQSCLGLAINALKPQVSFRYPLLPASLDELRIRNLRVGSASLDLLLRRHGRDVGINVLRRDGDVEVIMVK